MLSIALDPVDNPRNLHCTCLVRKHVADGPVVATVGNKEVMNRADTTFTQLSGRRTAFQSLMRWRMRNSGCAGIARPLA